MTREDTHEPWKQKKPAREKRKKHFQQRYGYGGLGVVVIGCGYYRCVAAAVKLKNKIKKRAVEIVYSLFFLTVVLVLILTAAITESKPTSAISPIGVIAGTGAGGAQSIRIPESTE